MHLSCINSQHILYPFGIKSPKRVGRLCVSLALTLALGPVDAWADQQSINQTTLSFREFLNAVLESNRPLLAAQTEGEIAREVVAERLEIFEPTLTVRSSVGRTLSPLSVEDQLLGRSPDPYPDNQSTLEGEISKLLGSGTRLSVHSSLKRQKTGDLDDYQYRGSAGVSLVHPLIRGAGTDITRIDVSIAELDAKIREHSVIDQKNSITSQAAMVYTEAVKNQLIIDKLRDRVEVLTRLKDEVSILITNGRLPATSAIDIEINLNKLDNLISITERDLLRFKTELLNLAPKQNLVPNKMRFDVSILPTHNFPMPSRQQLYNTALHTRHDIKIQKLEIKRAILKLEQASDMARDTLNVRLDAGLSQQTETASGALSLNDMISHPEGKIAIEYKTRLGTKGGANARIKQAELEKRNGELLLQDRLQILKNEVLVSHNAVIQTEKVWAKTRAITESSNEQHYIESSRLAQGRGNIIEVLQSQEKKIEAAMSEIEASTQYMKAMIQLYSIQGDLSDQIYNMLTKK